MNWDLTYLFKTQEDWQKALDECMTYIPKAASFKGKLNKEDKNILSEFIFFFGLLHLTNKKKMV
mgnify:CR=1 FL=1